MLNLLKVMAGDPGVDLRARPECSDCRLNPVGRRLLLLCPVPSLQLCLYKTLCKVS